MCFDASGGGRSRGRATRIPRCAPCWRPFVKGRAGSALEQSLFPASGRLAVASVYEGFVWQMVLGEDVYLVGRDKISWVKICIRIYILLLLPYFVHYPTISQLTYVDTSASSVRPRDGFQGRRFKRWVIRAPQKWGHSTFQKVTQFSTRQKTGQGPFYNITPAYHLKKFYLGHAHRVKILTHNNNNRGK
jgi:hypothetical protein